MKLVQYEEFANKIGDTLLVNDIAKTKELAQESLSFGTAGIRGVIGLGGDCINSLVIAKATQAYADFLIKNSRTKKVKVVIANDNRRNGELFKNVASTVLNSNGIETHVLPDRKYMATPILSFLIRELNADGGINITASHNPKEYNGYKVYDKFGGQLMPEYTKEISDNMDGLEYEDIKFNDNTPKFISDKFIEKYISELAKIADEKIENISVAYSPLNGTGMEISDQLFQALGINYFKTKNEFSRDTEFTHVGSPNPEDHKSYKNVLKAAKKNDADMALVTDPDSDRVGAVVKYKKRWKYLTGNDVASIYTQYLLEKLHIENKIPKDAYIVKSYVSTDLVSSIAKKYNVEVREVPVGFKNIANMIQNEKGTFLFGFEESYGMLINSNISRDKDAFQGVVAIAAMASYYKKQGKTLFDILKEINNEFRVHRNIQISKKVDSSSVDRMLSKLMKAKNIAGIKVAKVTDFRKSKNNAHTSVKVVLRDGSWVVIRPSGTEPKVKIYIQSVGDIGQDLIHSVIKEKKIIDFIDSISESFPDKHFSWKTVIKYSIFTLIMAGLLYFVFTVIYGNYKTGAGSVVGLSRDFKHSIALWIFFVGIIGLFFNIFIDAWMKYRLLKFHGQNVKVRHLFISAIMGSIISYLTPLAIGGDGIGYWYLRRKGFERAPLASTFLTSTVLWQMKNIVLTAILLPMGLHMFKDILINGDASSKSVMVIFVIGLVWDMFSIFMLWILLMSRKFQEFCVRTSIKLLEWLPFVIISDPGAKASGYMYEFSLLRQSMNKIWKSPRVLCEAIFYETLPKLLSITALLNIAAGIIQPDLEYGSYWSQIVASDVVNTANSISLTPGSTGFIEFISLHINENIFIPQDSLDPSTSIDTVMYMDIIGKFTAQWPYLLLSTLVAITVIMGESRNKRISKLNKLNIITKEKTSLYKKTMFIWPLLIAGWATIIVLF